MVDQYMHTRAGMIPSHEGLWVRYSDYAALEAQLAESVKVKPLDDAARRKIELWFFRDMSGDQRLKLFSLFGMPVDEIGQTHGHQRIALRRVFRILSASTLEAAPPAPKVTEAMVRMTVSETIRAMGANPDEQIIGELTVFDAVAVKVRAALTAAQEADHG